MSRPLLSIAMIVKNEIRCIQRCLDALQPLREAVPCELVIADTGSTDGTRELAAEYADIIFDFEWVNDFSAARNAAMDRCSGEWCLNVDADECLSAGIDQLVQFMKFPGSYDGAYVVIRNYGDAAMEGKYHDFPAFRLIRMDTGVRYVAPIHEYLNEETKTMLLLDHVIFKHDGYAYINETIQKEKAQRNMAILETELAKNTESLRLINQCIESSSHWPEKQWHYVVLGMEMLQKGEGTEYQRFCAPIVRGAINTGLRLKKPEMEGWSQWAEQNIPGTLYLQLDISYIMCHYYSEKGAYKQAASWGRTYQRGIRKVDQKGEATVLAETAASPLLYIDPEYQTRVAVLYGLALAEESRMGDALKVFLSLRTEKLVEDMLPSYLQLAAKMYDYHAVQEQLRKTVALLEEQKDSKRDRLYQEAGKLFAQKEPPVWQMLSLCEGSLGQAARILRADTNERTKLLGEIQEWSTLPSVVFQSLMKDDVEFPSSFYQLPVEEHRSIAKAIIRDMEKENLDTVMHWCKGRTELASVSQLQFMYELLSWMVLRFEWGENVQLSHNCYRLLQKVAEHYTSQIYAKSVLENELHWNLLPARFRLHIKLKDGLQRGQEHWIRVLRSVLHDVPEYNGMIQFLLEHPPVLQANPELQELAQKVNAVLSQYASDDPAVLALKETPIYQRVAHLLDEI